MSLLSFGPIATVGLLYGMIIPLAAIQVLALFLIASTLSPGARPFAVAKAAFSYLLQGFGVLLMSLGILPALHGVLSSSPFQTQTYLGFLILFTIGGLLFLLHEHMARGVDDASRSVPHAIYFFTFKLIGTLATTVGALMLLLSMLFGQAQTNSQWWVLPAITLIYGLVLSWCTRLETRAAPVMKSAAPMPMSAPRPTTVPAMPTAKPGVPPAFRPSMPAVVQKPVAPAPTPAPAKKPAHKKTSSKKKSVKLEQSDVM